MLGAKGYLQVFSATEKSNAVASDDYTYFNLHSGYDINDASRKSVKFLPNHASNMDEWPDQVTLPAGNYNIVAESACSKYSYKSIGFSSRRRSGGLEQFDLEVIGVNVRLL